jgi:signal transduction histidine kinase
MADITRRLAAVSDSRGRIVSIFVGAVLLPSIALSVLSFNAVPKQAENLKLSLLRQAEQLLYFVEEDLEQATRRRALEAARAVDPELLLEGRTDAVRKALVDAGLGNVSFESLRLEAWSHTGNREAADRAGAEVRALSQALSVKSGPGEREQGDEDAVPLMTPGGEELGVIRFRFSCDYAHRQLVQEFFETGFSNPGAAWVIRVSEPTGELLYENASTAAGERFEAERVMTAPSFEGVRLQLRYRDRSIEQEVRRLAIAKTALIGFIDVMLLAGLGLVWANVKRELKLSRLKSDFVANVSHELKTPLALIRLYAETLELRRVPTDERKGEYYRVIGKESRRLTQLINNILDFSRIEAGRKEYRMVPSDIGAVARDVVESYRFAIEKLGFTLRLEIADELPPLELDPEAISQALINLLNNAIKYSPEQKEIAVGVARAGDRVRLSVTDRGIGIPRSEHRRIFEKFYRVETSLVHTTKGSGLGLALVQHIAEAHGGTVELVSAPGEGSTFTLSLPVPAETKAGEEAEAGQAGRQGTMEHREVQEHP